MARKKRPDAGVTIHAGDSVVIPPGQIRLSLNRDQASGSFTRGGLSWFVRMLYFQGATDAPAELDSLLQQYLDEASKILDNSVLLQDLDLNSEEGASAAMERLTGHDDALETWALRMVAAVGQVSAASDENDVRAAALAMNELTNCRAMLLFKLNLEDLVWRGYTAPLGN